MAVQGPAQLAIFGAPRPGGARALARLLPPVDLVLVEGWKDEKLPRVEVHRRAVSREFACARSRGFIALVSDEPAPRDIPTFAPGEVRALADSPLRAPGPHLHVNGGFSAILTGTVPCL